VVTPVVVEREEQTIEVTTAIETVDDAHSVAQNDLVRSLNRRSSVSVA
jgi:hypothetical protein